MFKERFTGSKHGVICVFLASMFFSVLSGFKANAWTINPSDYRYDMSLYFNLTTKSCEDLSLYEIGAFIGGNCSGVAEKLDLPDGSSCLYMRIRSNSTAASEVKFQLQDKSTQGITILKQKDDAPFLFSADKMVGLPSEPIQFARYFDVNIGSGEHGTVKFDNGVYAEGSEFTVKAVADEGYHFDGWSDDVKDAERTIVVDGNIDISAKFAISSYSAVFKIGETEVASLNIEFGSPIPAPEAPEKEGYTFAGWSEMPETMPAKDIEINGSYKVNSYKLTVYIGDEIYMEEDVEFGASIPALEAPEKEGYTFAGWSEVPETMPAKDIVINGSYKVNSYKLTVYLNDEIYMEEDVEFGASIPALEAPEKEGYTFTGWSEVPETMPAKDIEINGSYKVNSYKLTVYLNDEIYMEEDVEFGAPVTIPEPELTGNKVFDGWKEDIPANMPAHDLVIHGVVKISTGVAGIVGNDTLIDIYNMQGVKLFKNINIKDVEGQLSPGIYVINGKKIMIK